MQLKNHRGMPLSPPSAGPNAVRAHIAHLLISKHDAAPGIAQRIANKWRLRRPSDLRHARLSYFNQVFGSEVRTVLVRTIQEEIEVEWRRSTMGILPVFVYPEPAPSHALLGD